MRLAEGDRVRSGTKRSHGTSDGTGAPTKCGRPVACHSQQHAMTATPGPNGVLGQPCRARQRGRCTSTELLRRQQASCSSSKPSAARLGSVTILLIAACSALLTPAQGLMNGYCASFQREGDCPPCRLPLDSCTVRTISSHCSLRRTKYTVRYLRNTVVARWLCCAANRLLIWHLPPTPFLCPRLDCPPS